MSTQTPTEDSNSKARTTIIEMRVPVSGGIGVCVVVGSG